MYLRFDFAKKYAPSKIERLTSKNEINRIFSCGLEFGTFSSGSRRYFLVTTREISLRKAGKLTVWINYKESDCHWSPDKVTVYKTRRHIDTLPEVGSLDQDFELVNEFKFNGQILSLH